jgi:hypothetical protein
MADQPRYEPYEESSFFANGQSSRPLPEGTVARGYLNEDQVMYTGFLNGRPAAVFPFEITRSVLDAGRERYDIYCTPCHDYTGAGRGIVVLRGFRRPPPSFHSERLREALPGHFFDVITNGFGAMGEYASQVRPRDRWAIIAYIRALQLSQNALVDMLPEQDLKELGSVSQ